MIDQHHGWNTSFKPLIWGLVLSLIFTVLAYFIAVEHWLSGWGLVFTIFGICIIQAMTQLIFFMHLFLESKPKWNSLVFFFLVLVMFVVIGGTLWIMNNLNYNVKMHT